HSCFGARNGKPARASAIPHDGHVVPGVPARSASETIAGAQVVAISGRCLSHGAGDIRCAGCGLAEISGEVPAAWRKPVSGERRKTFSQPNRRQDGHARGAARGAPELAAKIRSGYQLQEYPRLLEAMGKGPGERWVCAEGARPMEIFSPFAWFSPDV